MIISPYARFVVATVAGWLFEGSKDSVEKAGTALRSKRVEVALAVASYLGRMPPTPPRDRALGRLLATMNTLYPYRPECLAQAA